MNTHVDSEKGLKILCTILLSVFIIISGVFIASKSAYSEEKETLTESEKVIEYTEENASSLVNQRDSFLEPQKSIDNNYEQEGTQIAPSDNDIRVIPDRYNTGCKGDLYRINGDKTINGVSIVYSGGNLVFDFYYRNTNISGTVVIENCDFSDYSVVIYHESAIKGRKIKLVFKNCNFSGFRNGRPESDVFSYEFYDCSFVGFNGSNAIFCNCRFGGSYNDGIVPFSNITVKDSYFLAFEPTESLTNGLHSDGTQMYGYSDSKVQNIIFSNCRFEVPAVLNTGCTSRVNACIMLQLEFNDGDNIKIEDCIINGGGYSIYAWSKNDNYKLTNVIFKNIKIGDAKLYGDIYPRVGDNVEFTDVVNQDLLYVSSVWNDGEYTHVIVSNDTNTDRIIRVVTGAGSYDYVIKRCLGGDELRYDNFNKDFEEFPFDIDIQIKADADYVICFDVTNGYENQIRYVSFDGNPTYYNSNNIVDMASTELLPDEEIKTAIIEGKCGENISYYLDKDGSLIIDGIGEMNNYHSQNPAPWMEYSEIIISIDISEGITQIGAQSFRGLNKVESIDLPKSLKCIDANAFIGCYGLKTIKFYSGVKNIKQYAFHGTNLQQCDYFGSEEDWESIIIGTNNESLFTCKKNYLGKE